jgi:hypothetical protein
MAARAILSSFGWINIKVPMDLGFINAYAAIVLEQRT